MRRDAKRRSLAGQYAEERLRLVAMKRNDILPIEIRVTRPSLDQFKPFFFNS